jgi:hypothetical protein
MMGNNRLQEIGCLGEDFLARVAATVAAAMAVEEEVGKADCEASFGLGIELHRVGYRGWVPGHVAATRDDLRPETAKATQKRATGDRCISAHLLIITTPLPPMAGWSISRRKTRWRASSLSISTARNRPPAGLSELAATKRPGSAAGLPAAVLY